MMKIIIKTFFILLLFCPFLQANMCFLAPQSLINQKKSWTDESLANAIDLLFKANKSNVEYIARPFSKFTEFWRDGWYSHKKFPMHTSGKFITFGAIDSHLEKIEKLFKAGLIYRAKIVFEGGDKRNGGLLVYSPSVDFKHKEKTYRELLDKTAGVKFGWRPDQATVQGRVFRPRVFKAIPENVDINKVKSSLSLTELKEIIETRDDGPVFQENNKKTLLRLISDETPATPEDHIEEAVIGEIIKDVKATGKEDLINRLRYYLLKETNQLDDLVNRTSSAS